ncbi:MAG: M56 family metallopeptidase [Acidobacteriota bacterium]|nr:M56 family metallopeptidase [Acidobacteriota bacterium]
MSGPALWLLVPFVASLVFGGLAPRLTRAMRPRTATFLLSVGSAVLSGGTVVATGLIVFFVASETPIAADHGHWSIRQLESSQPFGTAVAVIAAAILVAQGAALLRSGVTHGRLLGQAWWASHRATAALVVIDEPQPTAYAVPGWPGRIITSTGLLSTFSAAERRAVLAHEQAHLDGRHDLHLTAASVAASVNPLLAGVPAATRLATERWADETAALAVGDRRTVAETIARTAASAPPPGRQMLTFGAAREDTLQRITALLDPPPARHPVRGLALAAVVVVAVAATLLSAHETKNLFEIAERALPSATLHR